MKGNLKEKTDMSEWIVSWGFPEPTGSDNKKVASLQTVGFEKVTGLQKANNLCEQKARMGFDTTKEISKNNPTQRKINNRKRKGGGRRSYLKR